MERKSRSHVSEDRRLLTYAVLSLLAVRLDAVPLLESSAGSLIGETVVSVMEPQGVEPLNLVLGFDTPPLAGGDELTVSEVVSPVPGGALVFRLVEDTGGAHLLAVFLPELEVEADQPRADSVAVSFAAPLSVLSRWVVEQDSQEQELASRVIDWAFEIQPWGFVSRSMSRGLEDGEVARLSGLILPGTGSRLVPSPSEVGTWFRLNVPRRSAAREFHDDWRYPRQSLFKVLEAETVPNRVSSEWKGGLRTSVPLAQRQFGLGGYFEIRVASRVPGAYASDWSFDPVSKAFRVVDSTSETLYPGPHFVHDTGARLTQPAAVALAYSDDGALEVISYFKGLRESEEGTLEVGREASRRALKTPPDAPNDVVLINENFNSLLPIDKPNGLPRWGTIPAGWYLSGNFNSRWGANSSVLRLCGTLNSQHTLPVYEGYSLWCAGGGLFNSTEYPCDSWDYYYADNSSGLLVLPEITQNRPSCDYVQLTWVYNIPGLDSCSSGTTCADYFRVMFYSQSGQTTELWATDTVKANWTGLPLVYAPDGQLGEFYLEFGSDSYSVDKGVFIDRVQVIRSSALSCTLSSLTISGPTSVPENSSASFVAIATWADGTTTNVTSSTSWSENSSYASISGGVLTTYEVPNNQLVMISASYTAGDVTRSDTHDVTIVNSAPTLTALAISGPTSVNENSTANYTATASWSDGSTTNVTGSASWSENSSYASISAGVLTTGEVPSNQSVTITASYTAGGVTRQDTHAVTIIDLAPTLTALTITGPASVNENSTANYTATASWSDGSTTNVTGSASWSENSSYASISAGVLTTGEVPSNQSVTITASYTAGGVTQQDTHAVTIVNLTATLTALTITGPASVNENSTANYTATASWSDGSTTNVTGSASWSENSSYASISAGVLTT
ncbi:MAG: hypothetical protein F9K18_06970, partial [Thermoanaerobaculia bacterium]